MLLALATCKVLGQCVLPPTVPTVNILPSPSGSNTSCFPLKLAFKALRVNLPCGAYIPHNLSCIAAIYIPFPGREIEQASKGVHQWEHASPPPQCTFLWHLLAVSFPLCAFLEWPAMQSTHSHTIIGITNTALLSTDKMFFSLSLYEVFTALQIDNEPTCTRCNIINLFSQSHLNLCLCHKNTQPMWSVN